MKPSGSNKTEQAVVQTTPYWIDDPPQKVYLADDHPDVVAISILSWEFAQLINNRDYTSIDGSVEYHLYTVSYMKQLAARRDAKRTTKYVKKNKLKGHCEECKITSICFNKDLDKANVTTQAQIVVTAATDRFFDSMNKGRLGPALDKNRPYVQEYKLEFVKDNGTWKINMFESDNEITVI